MHIIYKDIHESMPYYVNVFNSYNIEHIQVKDFLIVKHDNNERLMQISAC